ncbi:SPOSA6832_00240 [Sporobolomyces salmonicolor]|uniref:SPOSA6832_00240-mRNA-1:cds n=1 Tax=Sporidiobolus salmonicolor TaxID=5005 RepID=A0A0D6EG93_SPOSA|nr:SPOSA6832_00240 [Sporobolomyces salmonicolor]
MFRATRRLLQAVPAVDKTAPSLRSKVSTGITGLSIHPDPLPALVHMYNSTLTLLNQIPASAVYRQSVESITRERLGAVTLAGAQGGETAIEGVERQIGAGLIEEVILQAEGELKLAAKMVEWKAWEDLESPPAPGQWEPFRQTPSTTTADDLK